MPTAPTPRRRRSSSFGNVRKLPSGRWQASYWHDGERHTAPTTFPTKGDGTAWLASVRTDITRGAWIDPAAGLITFHTYATRWLDQRHDLAKRTQELTRVSRTSHAPIGWPAAYTSPGTLARRARTCA